MRIRGCVRGDFVLFLLLSVVLAGHALGVESGLNAKCPVLTDEDTDPDYSTTYQGKKVLFCCPKCRQQFLQDPGKYLKNLPQFADLAAPAPVAQPRPPKILVFLGRFHPVIVHFPIALILCAALAEFLYLLTGNMVSADSARVMLVLGAAGSVAAAALGWLAAMDAKYPADLMVILERHRWVGAGSGLLGVLAALCRELSSRSRAARRLLWCYRILLFAAAAGVALTGYLGGSLVYGPDHFSWQ